MWYVYLLQSKKDGRWYTGATRDLKKRFNQHAQGLGAQYTRVHGPYQLIYYEASQDKYDAYRREKYLKTGMGKKFLKNRLKRFLMNPVRNSKI